MKLEEASEGSAYACIIGMRKEKLEQEMSEMKEEIVQADFEHWSIRSLFHSQH